MGLVPPEVITVTSWVPVPAGATAVSEVSETTVTLVAGVEPKSTAVSSGPAPFRLVPVTVTVVPPAVGPAAGETLVTVGAFTQVIVTGVETAVRVANRTRWTRRGPVQLSNSAT